MDGQNHDSNGAGMQSGEAKCAELMDGGDECHVPVT